MATTTPEKIKGPLSQDDPIEKAYSLLENAEKEYGIAMTKTGLEVRRKAAVACEKAFHAFVLLCQAVLVEHNIRPRNHDDRKLKLEEIGREDLSALYSRLKDDLHTEGYYDQKFGPIQESAIREVRETLEAEFPR